MCEIIKGQRRTFRDQDPPRICDKSNDNLKNELEFCETISNSPTILQRVSSFEKCFSESEYHEKDQQNRKKEKANLITQESTSSDSIQDSNSCFKIPKTSEQPDFPNETNSENFIKELSDKVPSNSYHDNEVCYTFLNYLFLEFLCVSLISVSMFSMQSHTHVQYNKYYYFY